MSKTFEDVVLGIDWKLLAQQKSELIQLIWNHNKSSLWGLVELIDNLQDVYEGE